jgi:hypothetical protein
VSSTPDQTLEAVRAAVKKRGLSEVARQLDIHRNTLANALAGAGRAGTVALVVQRYTFADEAVSDLPALCTTKESAGFLRLSVRQLFRIIGAGKLTPLQHKAGGQVLIARGELARYVREMAVSP